MSYMKEKWIQEQEARYARLEIEEDKFYGRQVIEEEHGMPNVDEDRQKGQEMTEVIEKGTVGPTPGSQDFLRCLKCKIGFFRNVHSRDSVSCPNCGEVRKYA